MPRTLQVTPRQVMQGYKQTIAVPYCQLQTTLIYEWQAAYTLSQYGKDADVYQVTPQIAIITGARPFGFLNADEESCVLCEALARRIEHDPDLSFDMQVRKMHKLMEEFAEHILMKVRRIGEHDEGKREGGLYQYI